MKRIIYLLPVAALFMGVQSCCCDKDDDNDSAPVAAPAIQPNGDYAVDLGLSVKWATCNVGANTPEEYGDYYAWGDTTTYYKPGYAQSEYPEWKVGKASYEWFNYKYCSADYNDLTKYCNNSYYGFEGITDTLTILTPADDVAHYKWGGNWRMPTKADFDELLNNCNCEFTTQNGVKGLKVTSRKDSSQSIFLPAAGFRRGTLLYGIGSRGYYWSSSLYTDGPSKACFLNFYSDDPCTNFDYRSYGYSVRPVCP